MILNINPSKQAWTRWTILTARSEISNCQQSSSVNGCL
jgi:hypothetical protein